MSKNTKLINERLMEVPTRNSKKLTYKQIRFIDEYMICGNYTQAYRIAYPDASESTVPNSAAELSRKPEVQQEIQRRREIMANNAIMTAQEIQTMLSDIARGKVQDQFGLDASLKDRLSALKELERIQIDLPAKLAQQQQDNDVHISLSW